MAKKKVWDIAKDDIVLLDGKRFKLLRDIEKRMPGYGKVPNRILVNVDNPADTSSWFRNLDVDVEDAED